jgi:hypothetical protein
MVDAINGVRQCIQIWCTLWAIGGSETHAERERERERERESKAGVHTCSIRRQAMVYWQRTKLAGGASNSVWEEESHPVWTDNQDVQSRERRIMAWTGLVTSKSNAEGSNN